jgi:hypothetical protein
MLGYSPKPSYKKLLKNQKKLLAASNKQLELSQKKIQKLTVVIELSSGYENTLKACLESLDILKNEIDCLYFLHDVMSGKKSNKLIDSKHQSIQKKLTELLVNTSFQYSINSKANIINNVNTNIFVWCKTPVIFYSDSFKTLLNSYESDENIPTAI